ncbi:Suppressor of cytokine signaling 7 [Camelus dromedarius]|uniref:Suppressor of cytokine signaling 7 n=1 Tax=Camelus dromedarius TaxID=9838 RepID=A0A5N4CZV7_CAMDR|nr:Suppressor of cytokine signaling 7 [Camelus dromedarius]
MGVVRLRGGLRSGFPARPLTLSLGGRGGRGSGGARRGRARPTPARLPAAAPPPPLLSWMQGASSGMARGGGGGRSVPVRGRRPRAQDESAKEPHHFRAAPSGGSPAAAADGAPQTQAPRRRRRGAAAARDRGPSEMPGPRHRCAWTPARRRGGLSSGPAGRRLDWRRSWRLWGSGSRRGQASRRSAGAAGPCPRPPQLPLRSPETSDALLSLEGLESEAQELSSPGLGGEEGAAGFRRSPQALDCLPDAGLGPPGRSSKGSSSCNLPRPRLLLGPPATRGPFSEGLAQNPPHFNGDSGGDAPAGKRPSGEQAASAASMTDMRGSERKPRLTRTQSAFSPVSFSPLFTGETLSLVDVDIPQRGMTSPHPPTPPPPPRRSLIAESLHSQPWPHLQCPLYQPDWTSFAARLRELEKCWYWAPMNWEDAEMKLKGKPVASFLVGGSCSVQCPDSAMSNPFRTFAYSESDSSSGRITSRMVGALCHTAQPSLLGSY